MLGFGLMALAAALVLSVAGMTMVWLPANRRVAQGLEAIDAHYRYGPATAEAVASQEFALPPLLRRLRTLAAMLLPATASPSIARRLDLAGSPAGWTVDKVLAFKALGLLTLGLLGSLFGLGSLTTILVWGLVGAAIGFFLPDLLLYNAYSKRQAVIRRALPDTLDMLSVCVEAGLGFDAALSQVAQNTTGPMAAECLRMLQEMQLGKTRVEALRGLADRTTVAELRAFTSALVQASELGVATGKVLHEQSKEMRIKHRQLAEEKAQKLPVKILFPMMFCIFPALFIVVLGPAAISMYQAFSR